MIPFRICPPDSAVQDQQYWKTEYSSPPALAAYLLMGEIMLRPTQLSTHLHRTSNHHYFPLFFLHLEEDINQSKPRVKSVFSSRDLIPPLRHTQDPFSKSRIPSLTSFIPIHQKPSIQLPSNSLPIIRTRIHSLSHNIKNPHNPYAASNYNSPTPLLKSVQKS